MTGHFVSNLGLTTMSVLRLFLCKTGAAEADAPEHHLLGVSADCIEAFSSRMSPPL